MGKMHAANLQKNSKSQLGRGGRWVKCMKSNLPNPNFEERDR